MIRACRNIPLYEIDVCSALGVKIQDPFLQRNIQGIHPDDVRRAVFSELVHLFQIVVSETLPFCEDLTVMGGPSDKSPSVRRFRYKICDGHTSVRDTLVLLEWFSSLRCVILYVRPVQEPFRGQRQSIIKVRFFRMTCKDRISFGIPVAVLRIGPHRVSPLDAIVRVPSSACVSGPLSRIHVGHVDPAAGTDVKAAQLTGIHQDGGFVFRILLRIDPAVHVGRICVFVEGARIQADLHAVPDQHRIEIKLFVRHPFSRKIFYNIMLFIARIRRMPVILGLTLFRNKRQETPAFQ